MLDVRKEDTMSKKITDPVKLQKELFTRTEQYAANVRAIYRDSIQAIIKLLGRVEIDEKKQFRFADYPEISNKVNEVLRGMYSRTYAEIRGDVEKEWAYSNRNNDELVKSIFGKKSVEDNHYTKYFQRNKEAMNAFFERKIKDEGLNLSQRVWKYEGQFREELEMTLDLGIGEGISGNKLAAKVQQYLNDPDRFYRRFRVKTGEDENGDSIYGRVWKRRIFDKETQSYIWINSNPKNYNPGTGVYRSSYRNAQRLARTETNIAYRTADYTRWQQLDFVIGIEIKTSKNHPVTDICDDLAGKYPKGFKWTGWHPNCRCYMMPILAGQDDVKAIIDKILAEGPENIAKDQIEEYPANFANWVKEKEEKIAQTQVKGKLPYFIKDNKAAVNDILHPLTPEQKKHKQLVAQYGEENVTKLYDAFSAFKEKISQFDIEKQIKKLSFEVDWVAKNGKYPTSPEMVKLLEAELNKVQAVYEHKEAINSANLISQYSTTSKPINSLLAQIKIAVSEDQPTDIINKLVEEATTKIETLEKARAAREAKKLAEKLGGEKDIAFFSQGDKYDVSLAWSAEDKAEIIKLNKKLLDTIAEAGGNLRDYKVVNAHNDLAVRLNEVAVKYVGKQPAIPHIDGLTDNEVAEAAKRYLKHKQVGSGFYSSGGPIGGVYRGEFSQCEAYAKRIQNAGGTLTAEELSLPSRYCKGSGFINNYLKGYDSYVEWKDVLEDYKVGVNGICEKMPRYNGYTYRGVSIQGDSDKQITDILDCFKKGQPLKYDVVTSTTTRISVADSFSGAYPQSDGTYSPHIIFKIYGRSGVNVKPISYFSGEDEILFRAGTKYKILDVHKVTANFDIGRKGGWTVIMEEIL